MPFRDEITRLSEIIADIIQTADSGQRWVFKNTYNQPNQISGYTGNPDETNPSTIGVFDAGDRLGTLWRSPLALPWGNPLAAFEMGIREFLGAYMTWSLTTGNQLLTFDRDGFYLDDTSYKHQIFLDPVTGDDNNDGHSAASPFLTFQKACDYLESRATPILSGNWEIVHAAGTYPAPITYDDTQRIGTITARSVNPIVVRGPAVLGGTPTAIIDGTWAGDPDHYHGYSAGTFTNVLFRDLKFINFNGDIAGSTRNAILGERAFKVRVENCHGIGSSWCGVYLETCFFAYIIGGLYDGNRYGINPNMTQLSCQQGTIISNSSAAGAYWSRGSQGHLDNAILQDNTVGLWVAENSRVDTDTDNFKRNGTGVRTTTGGMYGTAGTSNNIFNDGTADANGQNYDFSAYSGLSNELEDSYTWDRVAYSTTQLTQAGVAVHDFPTVYTIPAYSFIGNGKKFRVHVEGAVTPNAATDKIAVVFGGMTFTATVPATSAASLTFTLDVTLWINSAGNYRATGTLDLGTTPVTSTLTTATAGFDKTVNNAIFVRTTMNNAADTVTIRQVEVEGLG